MHIAYLDHTQRIDIKDYKDDMANRITCAEGHPVIAKRGTIRCHHFAHKISTSCSCHDNKGEWHIWWQDRTSIDMQEVRIHPPGQNLHIADILVPRSSIPNVAPGYKGVVIEVQHSPMDVITMRVRESFYTSQDYMLLWIFDTALWTYSKSQGQGCTIITRKTGSEFPLWASYQGKIRKILDFGKRQLFLVTGQSKNRITGTIMSLDDFDRTFLGSSIIINPDMRPFHHDI